jgi:hypothetical protein
MRGLVLSPNDKEILNNLKFAQKNYRWSKSDSKVGLESCFVTLPEFTIITLGVGLRLYPQFLFY